MSLEESMQKHLAYDGQPVNVVTLKNANGMTVAFMDIGATWISACVPIKDGTLREVLLGESSMAAYRQQAAFLGASIGRYANRISKGKFSVDNVTYQVNCNQAGNCLHGGDDGFDKRRWMIDEVQTQQVIFSLISDDGDQGFPGNVSAKVTYQLTDNNEVSITYQAVTDKACPVNLTNHAYFNLMGESAGQSILSHQLKINADYYLPIDADGIPLNHIEPVEQTSFDFRQLKIVEQDLMADEQQKQVKGYDHSYYFDSVSFHEPKAELISPDHQLTMLVFSDQPALQLYTGNWLAGTPARDGGEYHDYAGIALETQVLPDSPNHPEWKQRSCILRPGQEYMAKTVYQFR